jgi:integrase
MLIIGKLSSIRKGEVLRVRKLPSEVEAIKNVRDISKIKQFLLGKKSKRDYLLFVLGINVGLRIGDLLSLKIADVVDEAGNIKRAVSIVEQKTRKHKEFELNKSAREAIRLYLEEVTDFDDNTSLFSSRKGSKAITTRSAHKIIKTTLRELRIKGNYGTHSLRKTFGYHRYNNGVKLETLQKVFNHSSSTVTLRYIGITREVICDAYNCVNL